MISRDPRDDTLGQRELLAAWDSALVDSGLPIAGLDAPRPRPRLALAAPLASGVGGEAELADLWLVERLPRWQVREAIAPNLPPGYALRDLYDVWLGEPALPGRVVASVYRVTITSPVGADAIGQAAEALLDAETLPRDRRKGEAIVRYDLRPFLVGLDVRSAAGGAELRMTLGHDPARGIGRPDEVLAALGEALGNVTLATSGLVRERLVLAETASPESVAARPARRPAGSVVGRGGGATPPQRGNR